MRRWKLGPTRRGRYLRVPQFPPGPQALPPATIKQAGTRPRRLYIRRGRYFMPPLIGAAVPGPQALPPSTIDQAGARPRRLYIRRGRYFMPPWIGAAPPAPQALPPSTIDQAGARPRRLYIRRGRYFMPPLFPPLVDTTTAPAAVARTATWQFILGPAAGGHTLALTGARNRKLVARLTSPSEGSFDIDGRHPNAASVAELSTDLHIVYAPAVGPSSIIYRGRIGTTRDSLDSTAHTVSVSSMDYREVLKRRLLYSTSTLTYAGLDQADIAFNLITQTQNLAGGNLGIYKGVGNPTGVTRTLTYVAGDSIGDQIQTMSQLNQGFDWEITPMSPSALALNIWSTIRGAFRGVVCEYGGMVESVSREVRSADYANSVRVTGDQTQATPPTPQERTAADIATRAEGRWDKVMPAPGTIDLVALQSRADYILAYSQTLIPSYSLVLRRGAWLGPQHIWLGDVITLVVKSGRLAVVDSSLRVQEIAISIDDDGIDQATLTVGRPPLNYNSWPSLVDQRLRDLERR